MCRRAELHQTEITFHLKEQSYLRIKLLVSIHCLHTHGVCFHFRASQYPLRQTPGLRVLNQRLKQLLRGPAAMQKCSECPFWAMEILQAEQSSLFHQSDSHLPRERELHAWGDLLVIPCNITALEVQFPQGSLTLPEHTWCHFCFALLVDVH